VKTDFTNLDSTLKCNSLSKGLEGELIGLFKDKKPPRFLMFYQEPRWL